MVSLLINYTAPLCLDDLYDINVEVTQVTTHLTEFGLSLGLNSVTVERINIDFQEVDRRLTEILVSWLKLEDRLLDSPLPNWMEIIDALNSPTVGMKEYAKQLLCKRNATAGELVVVTV